MTPRGARLTGLVIALALSQFVFLRARSAWTNHWLLRDAQQGSALVTKEHWGGHDVVCYNYKVGQKEYSGHSGRNWKDEKRVQVGQRTVVFFSASHPWLSLLYVPRGVLEGLPVILIVLVLEAFAVVTIIAPESGWAFSLMEKDKENAV
jgi:hypothetical protein